MLKCMKWKTLRKIVQIAILAMSQSCDVFYMPWVCVFLRQTQGSQNYFKTLKILYGDKMCTIYFKVQKIIL